MRTIHYFLLLSFLVIYGCDKNDTITPVPTFQGSLFVSVKDPDGLPVGGAEIRMANTTVLTDEDGNYFFTDIALTGDDFLIAEKAGYFNGSRRFRASGPQTQFVRIVLLPHEEVGVYVSSQAATISVDNKTKLHFPVNAIVRDDGSVFNGNVHVIANPIYGDDVLLSNKMPGNLTGIDASGANVVLGSFGMIAVELRSDNGELLQVASGNSVQLELAIANQQLDEAPQTIPLWSFDEESGYWVEEGVATRQGNFYLAQITHFSYWNCDDPFNTFVEWTGRFVYHDGSPAQNVNVCLTLKSLNSTECAMTDASGAVSGRIPNDESLKLSIQNECGGVMFETEVTSAGALQALGPVTLNEPPGEVEVSFIQGTALQCDGLPVKSGFAKVITGSNLFIFPIQGSDGHYEGSFEHCKGDLISVRFVDGINGLESITYTYTTERNMNVGDLRACDQTEEFLRYKIKGFGTTYNYFLLDLYTDIGTQISTLDSIGVKGKFGFSFDGKTTGAYRGYLFLGNQVNLPNGQSGYFLRMDLIVTEYGGPNEFIRGTFTGKLNVGGNGAGGNGDSDVSGEFAVRNK